MIHVAHVLDEELNFEALVITDDDSGDTIEVQRSLSFEEQDKRLGQDTYCFVREGATHYGGLIAWATEDGLLSLSLSSSAATALDLPAHSQIPIGADGLDVCLAHLEHLTGLQPG